MFYLFEAEHAYSPLCCLVMPWKHTLYGEEDDDDGDDDDDDGNPQETHLSWWWGWHSSPRRLHIPMIMTNVISLYCVYTRLAMASILQVFIMSVYSSNIGSTTSSFIKILNISSSRKNWEHNAALSIQIVSLFSPPNCALFTF